MSSSIRNFNNILNDLYQVDSGSNVYIVQIPGDELRMVISRCLPLNKGGIYTSVFIDGVRVRRIARVILGGLNGKPKNIELCRLHGTGVSQKDFPTVIGWKKISDKYLQYLFEI